MDITDEQDAALDATYAQLQHFHAICPLRKQRRHLQFLIVEDQVFSQKLLAEILQGARKRNNNETPVMDAVRSISEAWLLYLKKVPDIVFIDLGLADGNGHTLARAIRTIDSNAYIVIVTAKNHEDELRAARRNQVNGFVAKPYDKKHVMAYVDRYLASLGQDAQGGRRGAR